MNTQKKPPLNVVGVIGVGLIGGSFAKAIKSAGWANTVLGVGRDPHHLAHAQDLGLIDGVTDLQTIAQQADLILFATPVGAVKSLLTQMLPDLSSTVLMTDAGSTKGNIVDIVQEVLQDRAGQFIPAHPIAGSEKSGADAAQADLFYQRRVILTPLSQNAPEDVRLIDELWQACGAYTMYMSATEHDQVYASVSHLPHLIAYAYMLQVLQADNANLRLQAAGTGFRDFTRLAASSPEMWRDVFLANAPAILHESRQLRATLENLETLIQDEQTHSLLTSLDHAFQGRDQWQLSTQALPASLSNPS